MDEKTWIRGVNIGGWLLAERFITPYLFAVNTCHMKGDLCWYPGQIGIPNTAENNKERTTTTAAVAISSQNVANTNKSKTITGRNEEICDPTICEPILSVSASDGNVDFHPRRDRRYMTYPIDEYTLGQAFLKYGNDTTGTDSIRQSITNKNNTNSTSASNTTDINRMIGQKYMERHWDTFVTHQDLERLKAAGVTHLRVPMGYWIRGDVTPEEPYIPGGWPYFVRFCNWCRSIGLQVWADLHGAPGSENGFDNSGRYNLPDDPNEQSKSTCEGWTKNSTNVARTVRIIQDISNGIVQDNISDVVSGFGLLNEPFLDCDTDVLRQYYNNAFSIVRSTIGPDISIFIGDMFTAYNFNDGWWSDNKTHYKTYLDSHAYHVFFEEGRALAPKQHIAYTCQHGAQEVESCCYEDHVDGVNTIPTKGIQRIVGEWSGAYDMLPTAMAPYIMKSIAKTGKAPLLNRTLSDDRMNFLQNFIQAQMVAYEAKSAGVSSGWLFWNFKMEGGAFAEWDFLRGIEEGWIPKIPNSSVASEDLYGTCYDILNRTDDDYSLTVQEYPDPRTLDWRQWQGWGIDDDLVLSDEIRPDNIHQYYYHKRTYSNSIASISIVCVAIMVFIVYRRSNWWKRTILQGYQELK